MKAQTAPPSAPALRWKDDQVPLGRFRGMTFTEVEAEYGRRQLEEVLVWAARNREANAFQRNLMRYLGWDEATLSLAMEDVCDG